MTYSKYWKKEEFFQRDPGRRLKEEGAYIPQGGILLEDNKNEEIP